MKFYVNKNFVFDGKLDKGGGEGSVDQSILVGLKNEKNERIEKIVDVQLEESKEVYKMVGRDEDKEFSVGYLLLVGVVVDAKVFL